MKSLRWLFFGDEHYSSTSDRVDRVTDWISRVRLQSPVYPTMVSSAGVMLTAYRRDGRGFLPAEYGVYRPAA